MLYSVEVLFDLTQTEHSGLFTDCPFPWDPLKKLTDYIAANLNRHQLHTVVGSAHIGKDVSIGAGTVVEHGAMILGPAIIGKNCKIRHNAYIRENCVIGDNCIIGNASEVKHSILLNNCAIPHFNYVGDSILGYKSHLGAGAVLSNIKLMPENVWVEMDGQHIDTGLRKFGALVGDGTDIGCNAVLNPGSIIGRGAFIYPNVCWRGILPDNMIAKNKASQDISIRRPRMS